MLKLTIHLTFFMKKKKFKWFKIIHNHYSPVKSTYTIIILLPTFFQSKKSRQKCFCPHYSLQKANLSGPLCGKKGSGSEM